MNAASNCSVEFLTKYCQCLPDVMDPTANICGYVNRQNGLVYPCEPGCCAPSCGTRFGIIPQIGLEFRPSTISLPPGFNENLATNDLPTEKAQEKDFYPLMIFQDIELWKLLVALCVIILIAAFLP